MTCVVVSRVNRCWQFDFGKDANGIWTNLICTEGLRPKQLVADGIDGVSGSVEIYVGRVSGNPVYEKRLMQFDAQGERTDHVVPLLAASPDGGAGASGELLRINALGQLTDTTPLGLTNPVQAE